MQTDLPKDNTDALIVADIAQEPRRWLAEFASALDFVADKLSPFSKESIKMACDVFPDGETMLEAIRKEWAGSMASAIALVELVRKALGHADALAESEAIRQTALDALGLLDLAIKQWKGFEQYCDSGPHVDWREPPPPEYEPLPPLELNKAFELAEAIQDRHVELRLREYSSKLRTYCEFYEAPHPPHRKESRDQPDELGLTLNKEGMEARYKGETYPLTPRQTEFLAALIELPRAWISGPSIRKYHEERLDKVKNKLPEPILALIESDTTKGYRLNLP